MFYKERRFNAYSDYFRQVQGCRVQKISIDAGFTCPNRDGRLGRGGCTFCNNEAFSPSYCNKEKSIREQLELGKEFHAWRYRKSMKYMAYFQSYTNTYTSLDHFKQMVEEAFSVEGIIGAVFGTRPDCLNTEILEYLAEKQKTHAITLELGIESCYDKTLRRVHRGHDFACTQAAFQTIARYGIFTGAHLILGLPGESREEILDQARILSSMPIGSLKLHQLQILKGSLMEKEYQEHPENFHFYSLEEYVELVVDFLERLSADIFIERLSGEVPPRYQAGPCFGTIRSDQVLMKIEKRLAERDTFQGRLYKRVNSGEIR